MFSQHGPVVTKMEFNILDSMNSKVVRDNAEDSIPVAFELAPHQANDIKISIDSESVTMPAKLRGSFTYMVLIPRRPTTDWLQVGNPGEVKQNVLDFQLPMLCSSFVTPVQCTQVDQMQPRSSLNRLVRRSLQVSWAVEPYAPLSQLRSQRALTSRLLS